MKWRVMTTSIYAAMPTRARILRNRVIDWRLKPMAASPATVAARSIETAAQAAK